MRAVSILFVLAGCGTIFNGKSATVTPPPGATIDGVAGPLTVSQQSPHEIVYPDGRRCLVGSSASAGYIIGDILLGLVGIVIDAVTGDWRTLDADDCPGVRVD